MGAGLQAGDDDAARTGHDRRPRPVVRLGRRVCVGDSVGLRDVWEQRAGAKRESAPGRRRPGCRRRQPALRQYRAPVRLGHRTRRRDAHGAAGRLHRCWPGWPESAKGSCRKGGDRARRQGPRAAPGARRRREGGQEQSASRSSLQWAHGQRSTVAGARGRCPDLERACSGADRGDRASCGCICTGTCGDAGARRRADTPGRPEQGIRPAGGLGASGPDHRTGRCVGSASADVDRAAAGASRDNDRRATCHRTGDFCSSTSGPLGSQQGVHAATGLDAAGSGASDSSRVRDTRAGFGADYCRCESPGAGRSAAARATSRDCGDGADIFGQSQQGFCPAAGLDAAKPSRSACADHAAFANRDGGVGRGGCAAAGAFGRSKQSLRAAARLGAARSTRGAGCRVGCSAGRSVTAIGAGTDHHGGCSTGQYRFDTSSSGCFAIVGTFRRPQQGLRAAARLGAARSIRDAGCRVGRSAGRSVTVIGAGTDHHGGGSTGQYRFDTSSSGCFAIVGAFRRPQQGLRAAARLGAARRSRRARGDGCHAVAASCRPPAASSTDRHGRG